MTVAVMPASYDPITLGHVDIIARAARQFEHLIVAVYASPKKHGMFSLQERVQMVEESVGGLHGVEVIPFDGLLVNFVREVHASVVVRGLRRVADFEYEFQQAAANRRMLPGLEVICMFASDDKGFISSSIIREIAENGGDVSSMVPAPVLRHIQQRFASAMPPVAGG